METNSVKSQPSVFEKKAAGAIDLVKDNLNRPFYKK